jgi:hypothetical protein
MKHILNDLTEQEKNSIREQHTGGMKVMTENFNKLLNSKLGDAKPLVSEQVFPGPGTSRPGTPVPPKPGTPKPGTTAPTISFTNKTVNLYRNVQNTNFYKKITIKSTNTSSNGEVILTIRADDDEYIKFNCSNKGSLEYFNKSEEGLTTDTTVYNTNLTTQLAKTFCSRSSGGSSVPKADFADTSSNTGADFA